MIILIEELVKMQSSKLWIDGSYYREGGVNSTAVKVAH